MAVSRLSSTSKLWQTIRRVDKDSAGLTNIESKDDVGDEVAFTPNDPDVVGKVDVPLISIEPGVMKEESFVADDVVASIELTHLGCLQPRELDVGTSRFNSTMLP